MLVEIAEKIRALDLWKIAAPWTWAIKPRGVAFPYFPTFRPNPQEGANEIGFLEGWDNFYNYAIARRDPSFGLAKGIKVDVGEKETKIDVNIIVEYGTRIPDVAYEIQTKVKKAVETMTGLKVVEVNVHVQGVNITNSNNNDDKNIEQ